MPRRIAMLASLLLMVAAAVSSAADAKPLDDACASASPSASLCIGGQKLVEAGAAVCRTSPAPEDGCAAAPAGRDVRPSALAAYQASWLHKAAQFQHTLGDTVPLRDAQWLGTHNSFNANANGPTLSHTDSNQQLTLTQQLDADIRAFELDLHLTPGTENGIGSRVVRVCHGRSASEQHAGCTNEPLLSDVIPEIDSWLDAHPGQVILLYLEDAIGDAAGYEQTLEVLDTKLRTPDDRSRIYRPDPARIGSSGCVDLPLDVSRADVRAAGASVILVGNCTAGWGSAVFGWSSNHVESGSTPDYKAFPGCDATYNRDVYAAKLVRYYEDTTWLSATIDPAQSPADHEADRLTPAKVTSMIACGVNLFGFDQFDPADGRVAASIWSWAADEPRTASGDCAVQRADGRWLTSGCTGVRPAACRTATGWALSPAVAAPAAASACNAAGGAFTPPRTGEENAALRTVANAAGGTVEPWLNPTP